LVTAYASIVLLSATLLFGTLHVIKGRRPIVSTSSRRHLGVWSGVFAIVHVAAGLNVHMGGRYSEYFIAPATDGALRLDAFGVANHLGLLATLIIIALMVLSNDRWVRSMGPARWKRLQRSAYWLTALAFSHGLIYQAVEGRQVLSIMALILMFTVIVGFQSVGRTRTRARRARSSPELRADQPESS
jgi:sulfoxide reductase heme-binding subunit YedZ